MPHLPQNLTASTDRRHWLGRLVGLLLILAYFAVVEWAWGWSTILRHWQDWSLLQVGLVLALIIATYLIRAVRIWDYFRHEPGVAFVTCFKLTLLHNLANNLLPMRSGEASFPLLMKAYFNLSISRTTGTLVWFRFLDLGVVLLLGAAAWLTWSGQAGWFWLIWVLAALTPLLVLLLQPLLAQHLLPRLPGKLQGFTAKLVTGIPMHWPPLLRSLLFTWMNWSLKLGIFALVVQVFAQLDWLDAFLGALGGELSSILPIHAPAGLGTYEAGVVAGATLSGADPKQALQGGINLHILLIVATLLGGLLALLLPGRRPAH